MQPALGGHAHREVVSAVWRALSGRERSCLEAAEGSVRILPQARCPVVAMAPLMSSLNVPSILVHDDTL